jgi:hypothetical protein
MLPPPCTSTDVIMHELWYLFSPSSMHCSKPSTVQDSDRGSHVKEGSELFTGAPVKTLKLAIYQFSKF